ncbi:thioesterase family protein (plasmid) [Rhizobium sp. CB3060]|uniref:acyl-CoA thioesterase n=1 Tax=Rhizobium sp. CB3060 TaxID=3138255 RepID=UPI0021A7BE24|nr:thioesterase family protein [Rhizobium tropici]UWU25420.1 thioesterase family protein [Rhizobium tropici]
MGKQSIVTHVGVVHPWLCDAMGHLNVRHYAAMFDDASFQILGRIANATSAESGLGWAAVRMEIDFKHEVPADKLVTIRSSVETIGTSSLTCKHEMRGTLDDILHAMVRTVTVRFDLSARSKRALDPDERMRAESLYVVD